MIAIRLYPDLVNGCVALTLTSENFGFNVLLPTWLPLGTVRAIAKDVEAQLREHPVSDYHEGYRRISETIEKHTGCALVRHKPFKSSVKHSGSSES